MMKTAWDRSHYRPAYLLSHVSEAAVQRAVMERLRSLGILAAVVDSGAARLRGRAATAIARAGGNPKSLYGASGGGTPGFPDIAGVLPGGRALFIECKAPEWCDLGAKPGTLRQVRAAGKPTAEQLEFLKAAKYLNACAGVAWSVDDLQEILK